MYFLKAGLITNRGELLQYMHKNTHLVDKSLLLAHITEKGRSTVDDRWTDVP